MLDCESVAASRHTQHTQQHEQPASQPVLPNNDKNDDARTRRPRRAARPWSSTCRGPRCPRRRWSSAPSGCAGSRRSHPDCVCIHYQWDFVGGGSVSTCRHRCRHTNRRSLAVVFSPFLFVYSHHHRLTRSATRATTWPAMMGAMEESCPKRG